MSLPTLRHAASAGGLLALSLACTLPGLPDLRARPRHQRMVGVYGVCLMDDVTGDGVAEIGAIISDRAENQRAALIHGATGELLFEAPPYEGTDLVTMACVGPSHLASVPPAGGAFGLDLYPVANPGESQHITLSDEVLGVGRGRGCFVVSTTDGRRATFRLDEEAAPGPCSAEPQSIIAHPNSLDDFEPAITSSHGDVTYELSLREPGTPLVAVERRDGWSRELPLVAADRAGLLAVPGGVLVLGQPHPIEENVTLILFLAADTGEERARVTFRDRASIYVGTLLFNGRFAVLQLGNTLRAYDPATGEEVWAVGQPDLD